MSKKLPDATIKFKQPDRNDALSGTMPDVQPSKGLEHAEAVPCDVGCYRTDDRKIVCGVVLGPDGPQALDGHVRSDSAKPTAPRSPITVCVEGEAPGSRVCHDVMIDAGEAGQARQGEPSDVLKKPADD
jgi:hypothetical protein